jgi:hypothetical protein
MMIRAAAVVAILMGGLVVPSFWQPPGDPSVYYANASLRLGESGRVVVRFNLDPRGKAIEPVTVDESRSTSTSTRLVASAEKYLRDSTFDIGPLYRKTVTVSFVFELMPCGSLEHATDVDYQVSLCRERPPPVESITPLSANT